MSILRITRAYGNVMRLREIASTLARHGFYHIIDKLNLLELVPGLTRLKTAVQPENADEISLSTPERLTRALQELGASSIKLGQILATRPDLIPQSFVSAFARLQDQVDPVPAQEIRATLETRFGKPVSELFRDFDDTALASGSVGQVHAATLHSGEKVIVKVKRPGTDKRVRDDIELLRLLSDLAAEHVPELEALRPRVMVEEFARCMERELDYVGEAAYTEKFRAQFADDSSVVVPAVHWDFVSRDTLMLERIEGVRLGDDAAVERAGFDRKQLAATVGHLFMQQFLVHGFFHADPHPGNIFVLASDKIALIDYGQMGHVSDDLRRKLAMMMLALSQGETDFIVDLCSDIGVFTDSTDIREFRAELATLVDRYYGVPVERLNLGDVFHEALAVARNNGIVLPRDFVLLAKSFVTVMGVVAKLDPNWRADEAVQPFRKDVFGDLTDPKALTKRLGLYAYRVFSVLRRAPEDARDLLQKARAGRLRLRFQHEGLEPALETLERGTNRLVVAIVVAAITIGSSIVLSAGDKALGAFHVPGLEWPIPLSAIVASAGFIGAVFMGLWLAWGILWRRRF